MTDKPKLFGTDGIRGVAGEPPLDPSTVWKLGCALGAVLAKTTATRPIEVVLGEDTRESSRGISRLLAMGLRAAGADVSYAGVIPTPGVAFLARHHKMAAGVVVSASHNPYRDNGIKVLAGTGAKLGEEIELEIEHAMAGVESAPAENAELAPLAYLLDDYVAYLHALALRGGPLPRARLVVDCANGAASRVISPLMKRLGMDVQIHNAAPDGHNINLNCGSLHPENMVGETKLWRADLGVAFDGDADRAVFSTRDGRLADGDHVLYAVAPFYKQRGLLKGGAVVGTLMSNLGLELALARHSIGLKRAGVGDKYVYEEMLRLGANLGGEPSGHVIFSDLSPAGDGIVTLLQVLRLMVETRKSLDDLVGKLRQYPQVIRNVRVREKPPLELIPSVARAIAESEHELSNKGRVVVRYSGTEPLARVMVEAEEARAVDRNVTRITAAIQAALGEHEAPGA